MAEYNREEMNALMGARPEPKNYTKAEMDEIVARYAPAPVMQEEPSFAARVGRGALDVQQGMKQGMLGTKDLFKKLVFGEDSNERDAYTRDVDREIALYEKGAGDGIDWGRILGEGLVTAPIGFGAIPATLGRKALLGAAQGAASAGATFTGADESNLSKIVAGGVTGGLIPVAADKLANPIIEKAARPIRRLFQPNIDSAVSNIAADVNLTGKLGIDIDGLKKAAQQQMDMTGKLSENVLRRKAQLESLGFVGDSAPTTGQLTRAEIPFAEEQNLKGIEGVGEPLQQRFKNQVNQFNRLVGGIKNSTGQTIAGKGKGEFIGEDAIDAIHRRFNVTQKMVGRLYQQARKKYGDIDGISPDGLIDSLEELTDDVSLEPVTKSIANRLKTLGLFDENGLTGNTLTVSQSEGLRKFINRLSSQGGNRYAKRVAIEALDDDVFSAIGDDAFGTARRAARDRFKEFENKLVDRVIKGGLQPNKVIGAMRNASTRQLEELRGTLLASGAKGKAAWDDMRGQLIDDIWNNGGGKKGLTKQFANQIDELGERKLKMLFPESVDKIQAVKQAVLDMNVAPRDARVNRSGTAIAAMNMLKKIDLPFNLSGALEGRAQSKLVGAALRGDTYDVNTLRNIAQEGDYPTIGQILPAIAGAQAGLLYGRE